MEGDFGSSPRYQSYLLRLRWVDLEREDVGVENGARQFECQAMLQSMITRETRYFRDLETFVAFLKEHREDTGRETRESDERHESHEITGDS